MKVRRLSVACKRCKTTMKTNLPIAICLIDYLFEYMHGFYLI